MKKTLAAALAICFTLSTIQLTAQGAPFSPPQLDNLLAPVALYPDPLLAQVLTAATFYASPPPPPALPAPTSFLA